MSLLKMYGWVIGSQTSFTEPFKENDTLYDQACAEWMQLDRGAWGFLAIFLAVSLICAVYYYTCYNLRPGRHYRVRHWAVWLVASILVGGIATGIYGGGMHSWHLNATENLVRRIALANALYAGGVYFLLSLIWCNCLPTYAYRFLKFKK